MTTNHPMATAGLLNWLSLSRIELILCDWIGRFDRLLPRRWILKKHLFQVMSSKGAVRYFG